MDLYTTYAKDFSNTRKSSWIGWKNLLQENIDFTTVLDLGCGNARFLEFLLNNQIHPKKYLGVDNSKILLNIASKKFSLDKHFTFLDLNLEDSSMTSLITDKFSLIVLFGLIHHMHTFEMRVNLFKAISTFLKNQNARAFVTLWQFKKMKNWESKIIEKLSNQDYILSFGNSKARRFVHNTTDEELQELCKLANLKIIKSFESDGKSLNLNKYFLLQKNE